MRDWMRSASMARRRSWPGPRICRCPTYSARERGRIRAANGELLVVGAAADARGASVR